MRRLIILFFWISIPLLFTCTSLPDSAAADTEDSKRNTEYDEYRREFHTSIIAVDSIISPPYNKPFAPDLGSETSDTMKPIEIPLPLAKESSEGFRAQGRFKPQEVLMAFRKAYPDKVTDVAYTNDDWSIRVYDTWFYWAHGRLLPEDIRHEWERFDPYPFYVYRKGLPPIPQFTDDEKRQLVQRVERREKNPTYRHPAFYNTLWRLHDRDSSWRMAKTIYFLGLKTEIHRELLEDLAQVEEEIQQLMQVDESVRVFVKNLSGLEGYNWRRIAGTKTLSLHSYGVAIDILPKSYGRKQAYWLWAKLHYPEWFSLPYMQRFTPPEPFIRAFENHGFVWGGKWLYFDTIHFEYRPEILILNGF